ncbi:hypothetical protein E2C01_015215 [Portunus trituberculatus]|uniref:Uncharacterized protein n=1 Tax=Portunus trituberculatus TaxID=210409 RepID=A0A5B7DMC4_PORTR|nr:hypothetical protein [Portunus trituberculatus]
MASGGKATKCCISSNLCRASFRVAGSIQDASTNMSLNAAVTSSTICSVYKVITSLVDCLSDLYDVWLIFLQILLQQT